MKKYWFYICLFLANAIYSQNVSVSIENVKVNGNSQSNISSIELGTNSSINVSFRVDLAKNVSYSIGSDKVTISTINSSGSITDYHISSVREAEFLIGASKSYNFDIHESEIDFENENYLVATLKQDNQPGAEWESQHIPIHKTPTFNISPSSLSISCENTSSIVFSSINVDNVNGMKFYKWKVGPTWLYNGSPAQDFITTSSSTINLTPNTFPLSDIKVATIFNGNELKFTTCTINLTPIENKEILGDNINCSNEVYSINTLETNETVV